MQFNLYGLYTERPKKLATCQPFSKTFALPSQAKQYCGKSPLSTYSILCNSFFLLVKQLIFATQLIKQLPMHPSSEQCILVCPSYLFYLSSRNASTRQVSVGSQGCSMPGSHITHIPSYQSAMDGTVNLFAFKVSYTQHPPPCMCFLVKFKHYQTYTVTFPSKNVYAKPCILLNKCVGNITIYQSA